MRVAAMEIGEMSDRRGQDGEHRPSGTVATLPRVVPETPDFQAYCGSEPPRFANPAELEYAKILDWYGIPWQYEPTTFVLERDEEGRVTEAFSPEFYLPEEDLYLVVRVMMQSIVSRMNRMLLNLRQLFPVIRIKLFYERDFMRLAARFGLQKAS